LVWLFNFVDLISLAAVVVLTRPLSTVPLTCIAVIVALTVPLVAAFCVAFKVTFEDEDKMPDVESLDEVEFAAVVTLTDEGTELSISRVTRTGTDDSFTQKVEKSWTKVVLKMTVPSQFFGAFQVTPTDDFGVLSVWVTIFCVVPWQLFVFASDADLGRPKDPTGFCVSASTAMSK